MIRGINKIMWTPDQIAERMAAEGHRLTPTRTAVVRAVLESPGHFTVEQLGRRVSSVGRASLFRTMKLLQDLGVVCRVLMEDGSLHYRLSTRGHHHHLVCTGCGRVEDFSDREIRWLIDGLARTTEYRIDGHWLDVYGRCNVCVALEGAG